MKENNSQLTNETERVNEKYSSEISQLKEDKEGLIWQLKKTEDEKNEETSILKSNYVSLKAINLDLAH